MPTGLKLMTRTGTILYDSVWIAGVDVQSDVHTEEDPENDDDNDDREADNDNPWTHHSRCI